MKRSRDEGEKKGGALCTLSSTNVNANQPWISDEGGTNQIHQDAFVIQLRLDVQQVHPTLLHGGGPLVAGPRPGRGDHHALLGPKKQDGPEALSRSHPRLWARGHVAVAQTSEVPGPTLQRLRSRPHILRRLHHDFQREERGVSGEVVAEASR